MLTNKKSNTYISVTSGVLAAIMVFAFLTYSRASDRRLLASQVAAVKDPVKVVVAARNLNKGKLIGREDVELALIPKAYLTAGAISDKSQVIGRESVSEIFKKEPISSKRISGSSSRRASTIISKGKVALAIGTDEIAGVADGIRPGDKVNVFVTDAEKEETRLLYAAVPVVGIGGIYPFSSNEKDDEKEGALSTVAGTTVVLEVSPKEAEALTEASEKGKVRLALNAAK